MKSRHMLLITKLVSSIVFILLGCAIWTAAQSSLDKGTPAESKPGTSTPSTYAPDKLEIVNLANGNLSMNVPLVNIGGRGSASLTIGLFYNSKVWSTEHEKEETGTDPAGTPLPYVHHYYAWYDQGSMETPNRMPLGGGWSVSLGPALRVRRVNIDPHACTSSRGTCYRWTLTKLSLVMPDGAEVELRDQFTQGAPHWISSAPSGAADRWRGRVWVSGDGSATTYVSDVDNGVVSNQLNGWVFLADGTRIRMQGDTLGMSARFTKIIDRNGNFIAVDYSNPAGVTYTDQLGRQVILSWTPPAPMSVTVKGYSGIPDRVVSINTAIIGALDGSGIASNLRSDFRSLPRPFTSGDYMRTAQGDTDHTITGPHTDLFLGSESGENIDERYAVTRVDLFDGRSLRFRYNQYGEVAEVVYPGGGVSQIDYQGFQTSMCEGIAPYKDVLDRKVTQRRILSNGTNVDATWLYSGGTVEVHQGTLNGPLLSSETHYFLALKAEYKVCRFVQQTADVMADGTHYERWDNAKEYRVERQTGSGTEVTVRQWEQRAPVVYLPEPNAVYTQEQPANDPRVVWEETTLDNGRKKRTEYSYDDFNNVTLIKEYDFGGTDGSTGLLVRQTVRNYATAVNNYCYSNLNPLDPSCGTTVTTDLNSIVHQRRLLLNETIKDAGGTQKAYTESEYDNYVADAQQNHAPVVINSGMIQYDGTQFSSLSISFQPRGNSTRIAHWAGGASYIYSYSKYDNAGNVIWSKDPKGNVTTASFADNFGDGSNPDIGSTGPNGLTYSFATLATNPLGHQLKAQFDYTRGVQTGVKDANGVISKTELDLLGRPTRQIAALGLTEQAITETSYPTSTSNWATSSKQLDATRWLASKTVIDGFDRPVTFFSAEDGQHASAATFSIRVDSVYEGLGRIKKVSNPYRPGAGETAIYTTTSYNLAGRVSSVMTPDNAVVNNEYSGDLVLVTDQDGKKRMSRTNALGQLKDVWEITPNDPTAYPGIAPVSFGAQALYGYGTNYEYDVLDNLAKVTQGSQQRFFMYDALKRLIRARNPEQNTYPPISDITDPVTGNSLWCVKYEYDDNSNLTRKTDARGIVSSYVYDALNRNTTIDYSDTSSINPDVSHFYDGAANGKGRLWYSYAGGSESVGSNVEKTLFDSYDALGRPSVLRQLFRVNGVWSSAYQISRGYNLAGGVTSQTYPSGHFVTYNYDGAGRLADKDALNLAFTGNLGDGVQRIYSRGISYVSAGQMKQEQLGTTMPVYNKLSYNSRQQLAEILASTTGGDSWNRGKIINGYSLQCSGASCNTTDNNGNLRKQEVYIPADDQVSSSTSWYQQYDYDYLNRLKRVHEYTGNSAVDWQQEFDYDRWGNRTINASGTWIGNSGNAPGNLLNETQFDPGNLATTNRLYAPGDLALQDNQRRMRYDAAGNLIFDSYTGAGGRVYDAENHMTQAWGGNNQWQYYTYNADGQRTRRKLDNQETWQIYGLDAELVAEYPANGAQNNPTKEYGYRNGQLIITAESGNGSAAPVFADNFDDNSFNTSSWTKYYPGAPTVTEQSMQLQVALSPNTAAYNGVYSNSTYDLTGRMVQVELPQAVSQAGWCENYIELELNANNYFLIQVGAGNLLLRSRVNGVNDQTFIPFDSTAHRFWRIRHDQNANVIYFETSANDTVWISRKTVTPGFSLTGLRIDLLAGCYGTGNSSPGTVKYDNVKLLSSTAGSTSLTIPNAGFETPVLGNGSFQYSPTGGSWTFANGGGVSGINSGFTGTPSSAPEGVQIAFIQATGEISQSITGFQANTNYVITFSAAQRSNCCNTGGQDIQVYLDSDLKGTFHPSSGGYAEYSTANFTTTAGSHIVKFVGLNPLGGDHTAFIDNVRINGSPKPGYGIQWLLTDQLGTPRMVFDESGSLANVKRHDYLPFGEEVAATVGKRTPGQGYSAGDAVRQQFTAKERDVETGLDYFGARYYSSTQGRFTSSDPLLSSGSVYAPQTWNRYSYTINNPLKYTDPFGMYICTGTNDQCKDVEKGLKNLEKARDSFKKGSNEYNRLDRSLKAYGTKAVDNGVTIKFGASSGPAHTAVGIRLDPANPGNKLVTADNPTGQDITVTIDPTQNQSADEYVQSLGHEGSHVADGSDLVGALPMDLTNPAAAAVLAGPLNLSKYVTETAAYGVDSFIAQGRGAGTLSVGPNGGTKYEIWNSGWSQADRATKRAAGIDKVLAEPKSNGGLYEVTATNQGDKLIP